MGAGGPGEPADREQWRYYHRIFIDGVQPELFSEVWHAHEFVARGHTHAISLSHAYVKVEQEVGELVEAFSALTLLIRNMADIYGAEQAKWLISKPSFSRAEAALDKVRGRG